MKFKKALKLLKRGKCVKTPLNDIVKLDTERNCLTTFDGYYYFADYVNINDILSDDWQFASECELQLLMKDDKDDYDKEHIEPGSELKKEITDIKFIRNINDQQLSVEFNTGRYNSLKPLHTFSISFHLLRKMTSASQLESVLAYYIDSCNDCGVSRSLLTKVSHDFWRGNL